MPTNTTSPTPKTQEFKEFLEALAEEILRAYRLPTSYDVMYTTAPLHDLAKIPEDTVFGDSEKDTDLPKDKILGDASISFCAKYDWIRTVKIEGREPITLHHEGGTDVFIDPLDGSLNHFMDPEGFLFQHGYSATLVTAKQSPEFRDIMGAIGINFAKSFPMIAVANTDDCEMWETKLAFPKPETPLALRNDIQFNPGQNLHIWEAYYPEMREVINWASQNGRISKGWLRSPGSAVVEMMATALGITAAFVCCSQKMHELGTGHLLVKANGGVCLNLETGEDLSHCPFDFDSKTPVVLAANRKIAEEWVNIYQAYLQSQKD